MWSSETVVPTYQTTGSNNPKYRNMSLHHRDGLNVFLPAGSNLSTNKKRITRPVPNPVIISGTCGRKVAEIRSHWQNGLRRGSVAARLLGLRVRIPPRASMFVFRVVCLRIDVSATGRISPTYCGVTMCVVQTSRLRRPWPALGCWARAKQ